MEILAELFKGAVIAGAVIAFLATIFKVVIAMLSKD